MRTLAREQKPMQPKLALGPIELAASLGHGVIAAGIATVQRRRGARDGGTYAIQIDDDVGDAALHVLHLGDKATVAAERDRPRGSATRWCLR